MAFCREGTSRPVFRPKQKPRKDSKCSLSGANQQVRGTTLCSAGACAHDPLQPPTRLRLITVPSVCPLSEQQLRGELCTKSETPACTFRRLSEESAVCLFPFTVFWCDCVVCFIIVQQQRNCQESFFIILQKKQ